jgi:hypothetical protein
MPKPFLEVFPREIRDQIYTFVLASSSGAVTLSPWTVEVERSLRLLRTCKQVHRECKDIIWLHNGLSIRAPTELFRRLSIESIPTDALWKQAMFVPGTDWRVHINVSLELLDRHELEWIISALPAVAGWSKNRHRECHQTFIMTLFAHSDNPRCIKEFDEFLYLRALGSQMDGRLYRDDIHSAGLDITSIWPPFAHWGKHTWLREMLLDSSNIDELLKKMHGIVGGELWVDGRLYFKDDAQLVDDLQLDPRDGEIKMIFGSS